MLFNSLDYLAFFPLVFIIYFLTPHRFRSTLLILSSYYFYSVWKPIFLTIIIGITLFDFYIGKKIHHSKNQEQRRIFLFLSLAANLGLLFVFKYYDFFKSTVSSFIHLPALNILLPLGISFHTFQTMSYNIDIYKRKIVPEKSLSHFALFVAFFPQMVAGPIERADHFLKQVTIPKKLEFDRFLRGMEKIFWGLFKKICVADVLAHFVNSVYEKPQACTGTELVWATYFFAIQIYCDFSGYSEIAIGSAEILGFDLSKNFEFPYFATSLRDFWRRWHITLSSWFRDYLYFPLGGNRKGNLPTFLNLLIVFSVSGLWHGANWTYVIWGFIHGGFLCFAEISKIFKFTVNKFFGWVLTFNTVCIAWIFFRSKNVTDAFYIAKHLFSRGGISGNLVRHWQYGVTVATIFILADALKYKISKSNILLFGRKFYWLRPVWWAVLCALIINFGGADAKSFIYFQF